MSYQALEVLIPVVKVQAEPGGGRAAAYRDHSEEPALVTLWQALAKLQTQAMMHVLWLRGLAGHDNPDALRLFQEQASAHEEEVRETEDVANLWKGVDALRMYA